ncbi:THUMP domain-containing protein 1-like [Ptychodera flava]|uniref:THUMP domain-containing protein 1-like n=1 Tax=Ptychodera flava TaxID=63121 RepID=UPI00396A448E
MSSPRSKKESFRGKKRKKGYYVRSTNKKPKFGHGLVEAGMKGFLLSCNKDERQCVLEGYKLLTQYADELYGPECKPDGDAQSQADPSNDGSGDEDIETSLKKETQALKDVEEKKGRRFQALHTGVHKLVFIKSWVDNPSDLAYSIFSDVADKKMNVARHIHRLIPVGGTCKAYAEDINELAEKLLPPYFHAEGVPGKSFCVSFRARNNTHLHRDDVLPDIVKIVKSQNYHWVDLNSPELTIVVEIVQKICCMSVVKDFYELRKYNLQAVAEGYRDTFEWEIEKQEKKQSEEKDQRNRDNKDVQKTAEDVVRDADNEKPAVDGAGSLAAISGYSSDNDADKDEQTKSEDGQGHGSSDDKSYDQIWNVACSSVYTKRQ